MTRSELLHRGQTFRLTKFLFVVALFVASTSPSGADAQSSADSWSLPFNLSHSGVASNPALVIDSEGVGHALWQDDLANFWYARLSDDQWSAPEVTDLNQLFRLPIAGQSTGPLTPLANYTGPNPVLIPGPDQFIFAFWITPQGSVFTSSVHGENFNRSSGWDSGNLITPGAASFAAAVDADGGWHLAFLRTATDPSNPPGVYYTRSKSRGRSWTNPVLLYESPYYRTLETGAAHLSIAAGRTEDSLPVYVAWDNRPRKQVFMAKSADGGESWEPAVLVAGPLPGSGQSGPFNIHVGALEHRVVLVWQSGRPAGACSQLYQSSDDAGATWNSPQPMIEDLLGCAESNEFISGVANDPDTPLYFLTQTQNQVFLSAWNGLQWSQPQAQPILSGFEEPEIYTDVVLGCRRASRSGEHLYVIGCDQSGGGDVWVTSRELGPGVAFFASPLWSQPVPISSEDLSVESVNLAATDDGLMHAFISQNQGPAIFYTYWDGKLWSRMAPVLELPDGEVAWPAVAAGPGNQLFLITPNNHGALYFSRGSSGLAATESRWSPPMRLETGNDGEIGSVDVVWDATQTIYVVYTVPVNSERGIYLVQSRDQGVSWSEPLLVFDGAAMGFDLVGAPSLQISDGGDLHIIWREQSIRGDGVPQSLSLYHTRSEDGGRTFSDAALIVEEPVAWREIVTDGKGNLHVFWQPEAAPTTVWDQVSSDGGRSWQFPQGLHGEGVAPAIVMDSGGRLHLMNAGPGTLSHWSWNGSAWQAETPLHWSLALQTEDLVEFMEVAVNRQGKMVIVMAVPTGVAGSASRIVLYSARTLNLPDEPSGNPTNPAPTLTPQTLPPPTSTPDELSGSIETDDTGSADLPGQTDPAGGASRLSPFSMALLPVALLLLIALGIVIRRAAKARER